MDSRHSPVAVPQPAAATAPTFAHWLAALSADGFTVLAAHRVPAQLWLARGDEVLHFLARGTRFTLRRYDSADLTRLILRSECDCEAHRTAGAGHRVVLAPHAVPLEEAGYDGTERHGWTGIEAGLAPVETAAAALAALRAELDGRAATAARRTSVA